MGEFNEMLTYELLDTMLLADEGTISPVVLAGPFPMVIIPTRLYFHRSR